MSVGCSEPPISIAALGRALNDSEVALVAIGTDDEGQEAGVSQVFLWFGGATQNCGRTWSQALKR